MSCTRVLCIHIYTSLLQTWLLGCIHTKNLATHSFWGQLPWSGHFHRVTFSFLSCQGGLISLVRWEWFLTFASSQAVFCVSGKVRMHWGLLSGWTVWGNRFQDWTWICTIYWCEYSFLWKLKFCLLSLTSFIVSSDKSNSARLKWNTYFPVCCHHF